MAAVIASVRAIAIRLTDERWAHIVDEHAELDGMEAAVLEAVGNPERIVMGADGELLASRLIEPGKWLITVYREHVDDGFVITAFTTRRIGALLRRKQVWP